MIQDGASLTIINLTLVVQVILFFLASLCNPIFINTFVVFIRLYWFEKRFQNVVREARNIRRERTRSRTRSEAKPDPELGREEVGVGNRSIVVLHDANGFSEPNHQTPNGRRKSSDDRGASPNRNTSPRSPGSRDGEFPPFRRDIVFADEVTRPSRVESREERMPEERLPERRPTEQHIAFVENQRNPKDKATLRIPGPRDFDRGDVPERVEDEDEGGHGRLARQVTQDDIFAPQAAVQHREEPSLEDHPTMQTVQEKDEIHEPSRLKTGLSTIKSPFSFSLSSKPDAPHGLMQLRNRARTFGSLATARSQEKDPMPYLSWTPTIGRNSAFVDLTEEQREELGGIEYRALKTLAFVLISRSRQCTLPSQGTNVEQSITLDFIYLA